MGNSKVVFGNETLIDLTNDTVNENNLLVGETAHGANGEPIVGSLITHNVINNLTSTSTEDALSANQGRVLKEMIDNIVGGNGGSVVRVTFEEECVGDTVTFAMSGMTTITKTVPSESPYMIEVATTELGILTVTDVTQSITKTININTYSLYTLYIVLAGFEQWLEAGGITTQYASLAEVLADEKTVRTLFTKHASVDYLVSWAQIDNASATTILNNDYCAKWINLRDYALDTLYADTTCGALMDTADKYFYGEWVERDGVWQPKGNVPNMTSNSAPYGVASAYQVFDGNASTSASGTDFSYQFVNPISIKKFESDVADGTLQVSDNGTTWITNDNGYHLYARVHYASSKTVHTIQFYGRELKVSVPTMTSNTEPWGSASASSSQSGHLPWHAFDGGKTLVDTNAFWSCDGKVGSLSYKFTTPTKVMLARLLNRNDADYKLQGSNDNTIWNDLMDSVITQGEQSEKIYVIDNPNVYQYYRIVRDGTRGDANTAIYDLYFYGLDYSEHEERHWIYDHGVELSELEVYNDANGLSAKESDYIYISKRNTPNTLSRINTTSKIDLTSKNLLRVVADKKWSISSGGTFKIACMNEKSTLSAWGGTASLDLNGNSDLPNNINLNISSVNESDYIEFQAINISASYTGYYSIAEVWVE